MSAEQSTLLNVTGDLNFKESEVLNEPGFENLGKKDLHFEPGTEVRINNRKHVLDMAAIQGYVGEQGSVDPHKEDSDVTEMYFPLVGAVEVALERDGFHRENPMNIHTLQGLLSTEEATRLIEEGRMTLRQAAEGPILVVDLDGEEEIIRPTILPPGYKHATNYSLPEGGEQPRFLAIKVRREYTPDEVYEEVNDRATHEVDVYEDVKKGTMKKRTQVVWGSGHMTRLEWEMVCKMRKELGSWAAVRDALIKGDRLLPEHAADHELVEAGIAHGCPVITNLMFPESGERRTNEDLYAGYTAKNRAFRAFSKMMQRTGRKDLLYQWTGTDEKFPTERSPENVIKGTPHEFQGKLAGVVKLEGFWVGQLLRVLDDVRLGNRPGLAANSEEQKQFSIPWTESFKDIIEDPETQDITDVAIRTIGRVAKVLKSRRVPDSKISQVLKDGLPILGLLQEQGQIRPMSDLTNEVVAELAYEGLEDVSKDFWQHSREQIEAYRSSQ